MNDALRISTGVLGTTVSLSSVNQVVAIAAGLATTAVMLATLAQKLGYLPNRKPKE